MWNMCSPKSTSAPETGLPSMRMRCSSRCQPRGRTTIVGVSVAVTRYSLPSGLVYSMRSRIASWRLTWLAMTLRHSGLEASSQSASHTFAPELSALIVIFRSIGPVISTRRSSRPGAGGATRQLASSRMRRVASRKRGESPSAKAARRLRRSCSSCWRVHSNASCSSSTNRRASSVRTRSWPSACAVMRMRSCMIVFLLRCGADQRRISGTARTRSSRRGRGCPSSG